MPVPTVGNTGTGPEYLASSTATSATLGIPTGLVAGDMMVMVKVAQASSGITWTVPSGWVEVIAGGRLQVWWKIADTADLSTGPTISRSTSTAMGWDAKVTHIIGGRRLNGTADRVTQDVSSGLTTFTAATPVPDREALVFTAVERATGTAAVTASTANGFTSLVSNYGNAANQGRAAMWSQSMTPPVTPMEFTTASATSWQSIAFSIVNVRVRRGLGLVRG
jgi:hypothetical protein